MPKLDLTRATRIKGPGGEVMALKGPGFSWESSFAQITGTAPVLGALADGDTLSSAVTWGSYSSTAGTISTPTTKEMSVNGAAWETYVPTTTVSDDDTYQLRETVADDAATTPVPFESGTVTVSGIAPTVAASDSLSGRTLTITVDTNNGVPTPATSLTALTLDGEDVLGDETGTGPWEYVVPDSAASQTVAWEITATNNEGSDIASGSEAVAANLFAPTADTAPTISGTVEEGETVTINEGTYSGTAPITITGTLTLDGVDVTGDMSGSDYTIPTDAGAVDLVWSEVASNGVTPNASQSVTRTVSEDTVPAQMLAPTLTGGTEQADLDLAAAPDDGGSAITSYEYEVDEAAGDFSSPVAQGTVTPANRGNTINISPLTAGDYKARNRAVNAIGNGDWSAATADETVSAAVAGTITIDTLTYTRGTAGVAPDLASTVSSTGTTTANYTLYWATRSTGTALSKTNIENGTGDALDNGTITASALADLDGSLDLSTSITSGAIDVFIRDSSGTAIESDVVSETGVTYDAVAPAYSSSVVEDAAPSNLVITLTKATYEAGTLAPADFTLGGTYGGSISTATLTDTTTITLGLSTPVANGDTLTVALTDGAVLVGVDAEAVATWTAESVTNNVAAAGGITFLGADNATANPGNGRTFPIPAAGASGNTVVVEVWYSGASTTFTSVTVNGLTPTERGTEIVQGTAKMRLFDVAIDTAAGFDVVLTTGGAFGAAGVLVWDAGLLTYSSREDYAGNNPTTSNSIAVTSSETAGNSLVAGCCAQHNGGTFSAGTNISTLDEAANGDGSFTAGAGHEVSITGGTGTTYAMSYNSTFKNIAAIFGFYG